MTKLNDVSEEKTQLEWQLQQHDQLLAQHELSQKQLNEATMAYAQMHAQCVSLRAQTEDFAANEAARHKVRHFLVVLAYIAPGWSSA